MVTGTDGDNSSMAISPDVLSAARAYAAERGSLCVGTEHLLVGLFSPPDGAAARALTRCGATESATRTAIERALGPPERNEPRAHCLVVPRITKAANRAQEEADARQHSAVTPGHLLLALIADRETVATNILVGMGVDLNRLATAIAIEAGW